MRLPQISQVPNTIDGQPGSLNWPVEGQILYRSGETDAAGVTRPGVVMSTLPEAIVHTPVPATVRYIGPLLDYGQVVILEPQAGLLFILAGLDQVFGTAGDVIEAGNPLGFMGKDQGKNTAIKSTDGDGAGAQLTERLYIEVRKDNTPQDPVLWFGVHKDG